MGQGAGDREGSREIERDHWCAAAVVRDRGFYLALGPLEGLLYIASAIFYKNEIGTRTSDPL